MAVRSLWPDGPHRPDNKMGKGGADHSAKTATFAAVFSERDRIREETGMSDLYWLTDEQMERVERFSPKSQAPG